jgi:hypothetical protein
MAAGKIAHVQLVTIRMWLMQRPAYFNRVRGDTPCFSAYIANTIVAALAAAGLSTVFHSGDADPLAGGYDLRGILLSFALCAAATFSEITGPRTRRAPLDGAARNCGLHVVMVIGIGLLFFCELFPVAANFFQGWRLGVMIALSSAMAFTIGGCVPSIRHSVDGTARDERAPPSNPRGNAVRPSVNAPAYLRSGVMGSRPCPGTPIDRRSRDVISLFSAPQNFPLFFDCSGGFNSLMPRIIPLIHQVTNFTFKNLKLNFFLRHIGASLVRKCDFRCI